VTGGAAHSLAIRGGALFAFGANQYGQLGTGDRTLRSSPVQVGSATDWTFVASITKSSFGIRGGKLYAWGYCTNGELGLGDRVHRSSPVQVGSETDWTFIAGQSVADTVLALRGGTLFGWGDNASYQLVTGDTVDRSSPVQIGSFTDWSSIAVLGKYGCAGISDGRLFAWGDNSYGQLGLGDRVNRTVPTQVGRETNWKFVGGGRYFMYAVR